VRPALISAWIAVIVGSALAAAAPPARADERVVVRFAPGVEPRERAEIRRAAGVEARRRVVGLRDTQLVLAPDASSAVRRLNRRRDVLWAQRDVRVRAQRVPDDPHYPGVWGLPFISAPGAWDTTTGSADVTVAVIDTGVNALHPDLAPNLATGYDFVALDDTPEDRNGHGTHVAATIAARGDDGFGMPGVSWSTRIMPLRVLDEEGSGWGVDVAQAVAYAAREGAHIANLSLGGPFSHPLDEAVRGNPDLLVVAAAGNNGVDVDGDDEAFPCELPYPNVVCATALDAAGGLPSYANVGEEGVDLGAPGSDVLSAAPPRTTVFGDDFEAPLGPSWVKRDPWARSTGQSASGQYSLATAFGPHDSREVPRTAAIDFVDISQYWHCRAGLTIWLDAAHPADRLRFWPAGLSPGLEVTGAGGDVARRRVSFGVDKRGIYPWNVRFDLELWSTVAGSATRAAVDDVEVRCIDPDGGAADSGFIRHSGTSMAAAFVSGAAALVYAREPQATVASARAALLDSTVPTPALAGTTSTGGRLDVAAALERPLEERAPSTAPPPYPGTPLPPATGQPGGADAGYGDAGTVAAPVPSPQGSPRFVSPVEVLALPGDGVLAVGQQDDAVVLVRTDAGGALDPAFGDGGRVRVSLAPDESQRTLFNANVGGAAVLPDGRILVSATRLYNSDATAVLVRLLPNGAPDPSFGTAGVLEPDLPAQTYLWEVVVDGGGRIHSIFRTGSFIDGIVRFLPDGSVDRTFGDDGVHAYEMSDPDGDGTWTGGMGFAALHLLGDGRLVTSGCSMGRGHEGVITSLRLLEDGRLDPDYGDGGRSDTFAPGPTGFCTAASDVAPDGSLVVFGSGFRRVGHVRPMIGRLRPDGRADQSFGLNGVVYLPSVANSWVIGGEVLSDGRILFVASGVRTNEVALVRLLRDGSFDPGFGDCGVATIAHLPGALALDGAGRALLVAGDDDAILLARRHGGRLATEPEDCGGSSDPDPDPDADPEPELEPEPDPEEPAAGGDGSSGGSSDSPPLPPLERGVTPGPPTDVLGPPPVLLGRASPSRPLEVALRSRRVRVRVACPASAPTLCRRTVVVRWTRRGRPLRVLARRRLVLPPGGARRLTFPARRPRRATALVVSLLDAGGRPVARLVRRV
jgi:uncharacterized delta-60 repeat protein